MISGDDRRGASRRRSRLWPALAFAGEPDLEAGEPGRHDGERGRGRRAARTRPRARSPRSSSSGSSTSSPAGSRSPTARRRSSSSRRAADYRGFREGTLPWIGGIASSSACSLALAAFYFTRGRIRLEDGEESGRKILRFNAFERFTHWLTATSFIVLAISGLNYIFGKRLLMPLIGPDAFAGVVAIRQVRPQLPVAWPFMLGVLFMLVVWIRDNIPDRYDVPGSRPAAASSARRASAGAALQRRAEADLLVGGPRRHRAVGHRHHHAVPVLGRRHQRDAMGAVHPRHRRRDPDRDHDRAHLHRLARHGGRLRRHGLRRGRPRLGQGATTAPGSRSSRPRPRAARSSGPRPAPAE